jgi:Galactose oxidase, central domain
MRNALVIGWLAANLGCNGDSGTETGTTAPLDLDRITTTAQPLKRSEIQAAGNEATNSILMFGGNSGPVVSQAIASDFQNDTWIFEPGTGWTEIDADPKPKKRGRYTLVPDEAGHRAFLFGGRFREVGGSGNYELYNDLWEFDFDARSWEKVDEGTGPAPRYYPEGAYDPTSGLLYVFGGALNENPLVVDVAMDLWAWDGSSWTELETTGDAPSTRTYLAVTHDPVRNRMVVFAGQSGDFVSCSYNDLYALDLDTLKWKQLHDGDGKAPETRFHSHLQYDPAGDRYLMFGGHADIGAMNDLWAFDPETDKWDKVREADILTTAPGTCSNAVSPGCLGNSAEVPKEFAEEDVTAPERRYRGMFVQMHGNLWLGAGINIECSEHLDDTWRYDLAGGSDWTELVEARTGESCIRRGDDCACMCI